MIQLFDASATPTLSQYSVTGKVPVLVTNRGAKTKEQHIAITDSLAIGLHANDYLTDLDIWSGLNKADIDKTDMTLQKQRGLCQSIVNEMHSSFMGVRKEMPMNIRAAAKIKPSKACLSDLQCIEAIFEQCLENRYSKNAEDYLFGAFTIADAFYAPVILRLKTYMDNSALNLRVTTERYMDVMLNNPHIQSWIKEALQETRVIDKDEAGEIVALEGVLAK